jgi:starch phosphorylase
LNGVLNLSVSDGWWEEAYNQDIGWAIGDAGRHFASDEIRDEEDARSLYHVLDQEIVPLYFERGADGIPHAWLERCKKSIVTLAPRFSTRRMLKEYCVYYAHALAGAPMDRVPVKEM